MKRGQLFFAINYSVVSLWWTYRFLTNIPHIAEQSKFTTVGDTLSLIVFWVLAISSWVMFVRNRKQSKDKKEE